ncbi:hypothetical protein [Flagellimonas algicola]|uniref:Fibronectin type-III domain-containing protein n=1 Tax=Flagellimonas algicola TaxID=2583815 RepID=A0ABY2WN15_9FLAO|nr:hypothetical protein [Allomuricauda algicola]TMU56370.1 hypothetical protein FGG15_02180 [Allomuricauda algicola]
MIKNLSTLLLVLLFISCSSSGTDDNEQTMFDLPTVSTGTVKNISENSATVDGNVTSDGGSNINEKGVVWGQSQNPTIADNQKKAQPGTGQFSIELTELGSNTTYFVRAYAINSEGTAYGIQQQFTTLEVEPTQKIHEGDIVLNSQNEVESFGNQGYTEINGSLTINTANASSGIDDLST